MDFVVWDIVFFCVDLCCYLFDVQCYVVQFVELDFYFVGGVGVVQQVWNGIVVEGGFEGEVVVVCYCFVQVVCVFVLGCCIGCVECLVLVDQVVGEGVWVELG